LVLSLLSLLILYLWFLSNHYTTKFNLNLLWANPMFIYLLLRLQKSNLYIIICFTYLYRHRSFRILVFTSSI
jgi:hypothetical protein